MFLLKNKVDILLNNNRGFKKKSKRKPWLLYSGVLLLAVLVIMVLGAPIITHYNVDDYNPDEALKRPCRGHLFGTDRFGRDIFTRVLYGGRITLAVSLIALGSVVTIGVVIGIISGYAGGFFDAIAMRVVDSLLAFPTIIIGIVIAGLFGPGLLNILIAVVSTWWVVFARLVRGIVLQVKVEPSVEAAKAVGAHTLTIIWKEIIPKVIGPVVVLATLELGSLIISISALSFLGLGAQPPSPEWGAMLSDGRSYFLDAPYLMFFPGLMIFLSVLSLILIGEGLRDVLDPEMKSVRKTIK